MSKWQPIETAPKDRTKVDLWIVEHAFPDKGSRLPDAYWDNDRWYTAQGYPIANWYWASHWMPVPPAPSDAKPKGKGSK